ncbi:Retrovirus-related Pol polyprotein [Thelohanellus kitauei]|uniref:Retrovirus-related Pol polyprotein n=1 Tax=Thelohanellus kitauei TaxID=669202 RepID=A0A0C2I594_THEKT|nr:Retrovirus-related Pol polyprotein [Thelohanellus kitauei]
MITEHSKQPMERVAIDIIGPMITSSRGNKYILTIMEYFTKFAVAVTLSNIDANSVSNAFINNYIHIFGVPSVLYTDQGANVDGGLMKSVCISLNIHETRTTIYHPQSDGLVERFNKALINMISKYVVDEAEWDVLLQRLVFSYNIQRQESIKASPFLLMFGRHPRCSIDTQLRNDDDNVKILEKSENFDLYNSALRKNELATKRQEKNYNRTSNNMVINKGDMIMVKQPYVNDRQGCKKLYKSWKGPFKVIES